MGQIVCHLVPFKLGKTFYFLERIREKLRQEVGKLLRK